MFRNTPSLELLDISIYPQTQDSVVEAVSSQLSFSLENKQDCSDDESNSILLEDIDIDDEEREVDANISRIIEENKHFSYHPNDFIYCLLSREVFKDLHEQSELSDSSEHLVNWKILKIFNDAKNSGYYGALFINRLHKQAVLVHRGVIPSWIDLARKDSGVQSQIESIMSRSLGQQQLQSYNATVESVTICKEQELYFSASGYGFGGALAELSIYYCHWELDYDLAKAVTFESSSAFAIIERLKSNIKSKEAQLNLQKLNLKTYLTTPSILNCQPHLGEVYQVIIPSESTSWLERFSKNKAITNSVSAFMQQHLDQICNCFDPNSGLPSNYVKILDWPSISFSNHSAFFNVRYDATDPISGIISLPNFFKKAASDAADRYLCQYTLYSMLKLFLNFAAGNIDLNQLFNLGKVEEDTLHSLLELPNRERFEIIYKNHYRTEQVELYKKNLAINDLTEDYYFYKLFNYKDYIEDWPAPPVIKEQIKKLLEEYDIIKKGNKISIISNSIPLFKLETWLKRLIELYGEEMDDFLAYKKNYAHKKRLQLNSDLPFQKQNLLERATCLDNIAEQFKHNKIVIISGIGGIGKSTIAYSVAQRFIASKSIVRWFDAKSTQKLMTKFSQLAKELEISLTNKSPDIIRNQIYAQLSHLREILFVFDNVEKVEHIKEYLLCSSNISILITTRNANLKIANSSSVEVPFFSEEETAEYIKLVLGRRITEKDIERINRVANNFPYRLQRVTSFLANNKFITTKEYIKKYVAARDECDTRIAPDFAIAIQKLIEKDSKSWDIAQYLAYLDGDFIPASILRKLGLSRNELKDIEHKLASLSIARFMVKDGEILGLQMHNLLQEDIKVFTSLKPEICLPPSSILEKLGKILYELFPQLNDIPSDQWQYSKAYASGTLEVLSSMEKYNLAPEIRAKLYSKLGEFASKIELNYSQALTYHQAALQIWRSLDYSTKIASSLSCISTIYKWLGDYEHAIKYKNDAIELYEKEPVKESLAKRYSELAWIYQKLGKSDQSITYAQKSIGIYKTIFDQETLHLIRPLHILSYAECKMGNFIESLKHGNTAYELSKNHFGEDHIVSANQLNNLAAINYKLGNLVTSIDFLQKTLNIFIKHYSNDHPFSATIMNNLGLVMIKNQDIEEARCFLTDAYNIYKKFFNDDHPKLEKITCDLGLIKELSSSSPNCSNERPAKRARCC
jgi:tetratricopeptide (TPR) repeat protein